MAMTERNRKERARDQLPHSSQAERDVLGAILRSGDNINRVIEVLQDPALFYERRHQLIFEAMLELYDRSEPCDVTTVSTVLERRDELQNIGGRVYLVDLVEEATAVSNVVSHSNIVLETGVSRKLIATSNEIVANCFAQERSVDELLDEAEANIFRISESRLRQGFVPFKSLVTNQLEEIDAMQIDDGGLAGLHTGFMKLDEMTLGLQKGDLVIVAGRPSMGKTALAMNIAEHVATREKNPQPVAIFSIEMSKEALVLRMLCGRAKLDQQKLRSGKIRESEWPRLNSAGNALSNAPIFVDDSPSLSPLEMRAKARRLKAQHGLGLIVVDYIQLMHAAGRAENRQQEISYISRNIKGLAKELEVPVIALSQLSRAPEQRTGEKRPQLSDLRESGAIEQDADLVLLLYRPEFYMSHLDRNDPKYLEMKGKAEVIVAKQRNGPTGVVHLVFKSDLARFENPEFRREELPPDADPVGDENIPF